jgi:imidazolonepropionase-like amidohydrolase
MIKRTGIFLALLIMVIFSFSQETDSDLIAIKGATIIPVVGKDIPEGIILIRDGLIEDLGKDINIPPNARVIAAKGLYAYPGMIDSLCYLGLSEIMVLRSTVDYRETGRINPQLKAVEALRPDSVHIPIARANGITAALVAPSGSLITGQSGLIRLVGWTPEEMVIKSPVAMHIEFPSLPRRFRERETEPREESSKRVEELKKILNDARYYAKRKEVARKNLLLPFHEFDEGLEFLIPVVKGELPAMISVHMEKDIKAAIKFVEEEKIKAIFFGVEQGWRVADDLKKAGIPVILSSLNTMPPEWEDGYDGIYRNATVLHKAGVKFAFSSQSSSMAKDLPYHAAKAAAFGLERKEALKGVTVNPAEILGVNHLIGSLEKGKIANIVLADGDILELRTNIKHVFIDGKEMDLSTKYTRLLEKFKKRN